MTRLTEDDVRRIIREEISAAFDARQDTLRSVRADIARVAQAAADKLSQIAPVINVHNPVAGDPVKTAAEAIQYVKAYTRLRPEERLRGAANSATFRFTARELKRILAILPGLEMLHPELDRPALVTEARQILSDAAAAGDE